MDNEIYFSLDCETDGPCPGINNMLTLGAAAFTRQGKQVSEFYARIERLPDSRPDPKTLIWWANQSDEACEEAFGNPKESFLRRKPAFDTMIKFAAWIERVDNDNGGINRRIAMGWPAVYDFAYVNYYCHRFLGKNPLGYSALDIRSYVMGVCRQLGYYDLKESEINNLFGEFDKTGLRPHYAIDDAIKQGRLFFHIKQHKMASADLIINYTAE